MRIAAAWHRSAGHASLRSFLFIRHPINKFAHTGMGQQPFYIHAVALQFRVGEIGDQRLLANGVHRHNIAPATAFRHGMVPDNGFAGWPSA
jgi:hypothetical protein